jgi:NHL repeat
MKPKTYGYIGGGLLAAVILAISGWGPMAAGDSSQNPVFAVDPSWPNPLPAPIGSDGAAHPWVTGEVAGSCTDKFDNVYTFNRGWEVGVTVNGVLQGNQGGAIVGQDAFPPSIPSPPVVEYDSDGNAIAGWGNPSLIQTGADYGFAAYLPHGAHGCYVDYEGNIWLGGNGDGIVQKYNPNIAAREGASATFVLQIGTKGMCDGTQPPGNLNPFSSCGETNGNNSSHTLLNEPPDIAVDPLPDPVTGKRGSIYIADGYGNHRVVVFNADGTYSRQWGTTCMINGQPAIGQNCPPGTFGATGGGHPHCIVLGNDGNVYVCDRPNSRIQVFDRSCGAASDPSTGFQPVCQPKRIINIGASTGPGSDAFQNAAPADAAAILLAGTRACDIDFWPNIDYLATKSPTSQSTIVDVDLGNDNTWLLNKASGIVVGALGICGLAPCPGHNAAHFAFGHMTNVDSKGNIYVSETVTGRRIQKFVPVR